MESETPVTWLGPSRGEIADGPSWAAAIDFRGRPAAVFSSVSPSSPGTATERDVIAVHDRENRLCELVDGALVEKVMGFDESRFAILLGAYLF